MSIVTILIPIISAFIGWFTNWVAIKMLFHPKKPIFVLGLRIQGIFPKNQQQFAEKLGKVVGSELLSFSELEEKITKQENIDKLIPLVDSHIENFLKNKLKETMPMIAMFISDKTIDQLKTVFITELQSLFPNLMQQYMQQLKTDLDFEKIVTEKVSNFSSDKLEQILLQIMSKEFRFVEILGGVLGFIIGVLQVFLTRIA